VVLRIAPDAEGLVEAADSELEAMRALAKRTEETRLRRMFRALLKEQEDLAWAPEPFAVLEMAVVRLATMPPGDDVAKLLARIDALERRLSGEARKTTGSGSGGSGEAQAPRAQPAKRGKTGATEEGAGETRAESDANLPEDSSTSAATVYDRLRSLAQEQNRGLFAALQGGRLVAREAGRVEIELPTSVATRQLETRIGDLEQVCERFFGEPTRVTLSTRGSATPEPESGPGEDQARRQRQEALSHPNVNQALEILSGEIVEIRPLGGAR